MGKDRLLPIGIQGFEKLRSEQFVYVDKTEYIYRMTHDKVPFFLSRPRRFGKSLFLSAMRAYWEGKKDLFRGLAIEKMEAGDKEAWKNYPVFYFDFNGENYRSTTLEYVLDQQLYDWEQIYGSQFRERTLAERFRKLIELASAQTGLRCVVLVDEYDKPLLDVMEDRELEEHNKQVFKSFFSTLKKADENIQFVLITGVTKFNKVSIFSDLNQLNDISLSEDYAGLCGITEDELRQYFMPEIEELAKKQNMTVERTFCYLKERYDGYRFHPDSPSVYNPFSLLKAFYEKDFGSYWFDTRTPTFLVKKLTSEGFDVQKLTNRTLYANGGMLSDYRFDNPDPVPLLFQTGYLTIVNYDRDYREYTLAFPNDEVKYGFLENLMPEYVPDYGMGTGKDIFTLRRYVERGELDHIRNVLTALFAGIPYTVKNNPFEHYFQTVIYLVFTLLGQFVHCELHTFTGRIDCIVETGKFVYLFEFKRDDTAQAALKQIEMMNYALSYAADPRKLYRIGAVFDSDKRILAEWKVEG